MNEQQESNIFFMDAPLSQESNIQPETQNFASFNQIMFSDDRVDEVTLNTNHINITLPVMNQTEDTPQEIIQDPPTMLDVNKTNRKDPPSYEEGLLQSRLLKGIDNLDVINGNNNLIITFENNDELKSNDLNSYLTNINFLNGQTELDVEAVKLEPNEIRNSASNLICDICKEIFDSVNNMDAHHCLDINTFVTEIGKDLKGDRFEVNIEKNSCASNGIKHYYHKGIK